MVLGIKILLCILSVFTISVSGQDVFTREDPRHYQDVMATAMHARSKYLKASNEKLFLSDQQDFSASFHDDVSTRAARLLLDDPVGAPVDWRFDVSEVCVNHTEMLLQALVNREFWALQSEFSKFLCSCLLVIYSH